MPEHFDAALFGKDAGGFVFGGDQVKVATALRALADRIEARAALLLKVHSGSFLRPDDYAERSVLIRYVEKVSP